MVSIEEEYSITKQWIENNPFIGFGYIMEKGKALNCLTHYTYCYPLCQAIYELILSDKVEVIEEIVNLLYKCRGVDSLRVAYKIIMEYHLKTLLEKNKDDNMVIIFLCIKYKLNKAFSKIDGWVD